jgi:hypothetical protein
MRRPPVTLPHELRAIAVAALRVHQREAEWPEGSRTDLLRPPPEAGFTRTEVRLNVKGHEDWRERRAVQIAKKVAGCPEIVQVQHVRPYVVDEILEPSRDLVRRLPNIDI